MTKASLSALLLTLAASVSTFLPTAANALVALDGTPGKKHVVRIPSHELTRIAIKDGRIQSLRYVDGELDVVQDQAQGSAYLKPLVLNKQISLFVISGSGATHEVLLDPIETMPLESIEIKDPAPKETDEQASTVAKASALDEQVQRLISEMWRRDTTGGQRRDGPTVGIAYERLQVPMALWDQTEFVLNGRYRARAMVGESFSLTNTSNSVLSVAEPEFFKPGVIAIAIRELSLKPGAKTQVYVIKAAGNE